MPRKFRDLREYIAFLEASGDLRRVSTPVSAHLEITEIADRMVKSGGPALLFENVEGHDMPLLINAFGSIPRVSAALGVDRLDDLTERLRDLLGIVKEPHQGLFAKLKALGQLAHIASFQPKTVRSAPCQEVFI
ncbi:MAG: UbiD family decarboxylase, partial [Chloroflexota bacterium]|nr:UbiD family decarboxylase [Chloroflexota bacterium]